MGIGPITAPLSWGDKSLEALPSRPTTGKGTLFPMRQSVLRLIDFSETDQKEELSDDYLEIKFRDLLLH